MMIGTVVGNYEVRSKVGEGGMGAVYRGVDLLLEREVAIKVLRPELYNTPQLADRFHAEAVALARLNHPNIATLYNYLHHGAESMMIMEFVRGETLEALLRRLGALSIESAIALFAQALDGLAHAHTNGIVHRDLKPANLMLTTTGVVKVMDFGIARVIGGGRMTKSGRLIGTLEYMSPEQVRGLDTDARSDIYSLGIVLYQMLTGQVPFTSDSDYELMRAHLEAAPTPPRFLAPHLPYVVESLILRALAKDPADRFQSAAEFRTALDACLTGNFSPSRRTEVIAPLLLPDVCPVNPVSRSRDSYGTPVYRTPAPSMHSGNYRASVANTPRRAVWAWAAAGALLVLLIGAAASIIVVRQVLARGTSSRVAVVVPTPTPAPAPTPTPTPAPTPVQIVEPTPTPAGNLDPFATPTPRPVSTPESKSRPQPQRSHPATHPATTHPTPRPGATPAPTPTSTPAPAPTRQPTVVVVVRPTPAPTVPPARYQPTPVPTPTPEKADKKKKKEKEAKDDTDSKDNKDNKDSRESREVKEASRFAKEQRERRERDAKVGGYVRAAQGIICMFKRC